VALDHLLFPKGVLAWLDSRMPVLAGEEVTGWQGFRRFVMVQDTGGAIRGPGRLDLFFGPGPDAEARAGRMMEPGQVFFLVLKPETK
jgi:membrane-bound lytic murein transglycosylase A